ncbi:MAG TPA: AAA family ATPase, partial [Acidimicrobiia bacterium]|nr:AAA family ATPase [Acidimicrobiia bacterium]
MWHRFHGRDRERDQIVGLLEAAETGRGQTLLVEGAEGMGKSALLAAATAEAERRGFGVATAQAGGGNDVPPLAPFFHALGEATSAAGPGDAPPTSDRRSWLMEQLWLIEQLPLLLTARSENGPLLVTIDDLQWADPTTLLALRVLPPRLAPSHFCWLVTRRSGEGGPALDQLFDMLEHDGAGRTVLGPLGDDTVAETLTDVIGAVPAPNVLALAGEAGGNPGLVVALAEGLRDEDGLVIEGGRARLASERLPRRFHALVADRLAPLAPETGHLLEVASLLDRWFAVDELAAVLGKPPSGLLPVLDEALGAGVLQTTGPHLGFWCGLARRAVAETIPEPVRNALRRQIGSVSRAR